MIEPYATRRELDMVKENLASLSSRVDNIDQHGSRGIQAMALQITDAIKDIAEVKIDLQKFETDHLAMHEKERQTRTSGRRWLTTTIIAVLVLLVSILAIVVELIGRIPHK